MTKIFDPEITPGEWKKDFSISGEGQIEVENGQRVLLQFNRHFPHKEDLKAVSAIPEYKTLANAVRKFIPELKEFIENEIESYKRDSFDDVGFYSLCKALKELDEKHGTEIISDET